MSQVVLIPLDGAQAHDHSESQSRLDGIRVVLSA